MLKNPLFHPLTSRLTSPLCSGRNRIVFMINVNTQVFSHKSDIFGKLDYNV